MSDKPPMAPAECAAALERNLARLLQMMAAADSRSGFVLALDTAMLGVLAALSPRASDWSVAPAVISAVAALGLAASLVLLAVSTFPRTKGPKGSMVYFEGISSRSLDQYLQEFTRMTLEEYADDLAKQCHRNSEIAKAKFGWLRASMIALFLSIPLWALAVFLLYQEAR